MCTLLERDNYSITSLLKILQDQCSS